MLQNIEFSYQYCSLMKQYLRVESLQACQREREVGQKGGEFPQRVPMYAHNDLKH